MRYFYVAGVLALLVLVPLQMEVSWLPSDSPSVLDPALVGFLAFLAVVVVCIFAFFAYRALWWDGGWVERSVARHNTALPPAGRN